MLRCGIASSHAHILYEYSKRSRCPLLDLSVFGDDLEIPEDVPAFEGGGTPMVASGREREEEGEEGGEEGRGEDPTGQEDVAPGRARRTVDLRSMALQSLRNFTDF